MSIPIIQILRTIRGGEPLLRTLPPLTLRRNERGEVIYSVGNSALLLTIWHNEMWCSLKCYTTPSPRRKAIYGERLLPAELYVICEDGSGEWIDLLIEPWREGITLAQYIDKAAGEHDRVTLCELSTRFDAFALELLAQEWAHGDITCDNIIVDGNLELHLIDFDALFLPSLSHLQSTELGTKGFQHPARSVDDYNRNLDDYPLTLISTALALLSKDPSLHTPCNEYDGLLFSPSEILAGRSHLYTHAMELFAKECDPLPYNIARMLQSRTLAIAELYPILRLKVEGIPQEISPSEAYPNENGVWGFINEYRRGVIPPLFDEACDFRQGVAKVRLGSWWHIVDRQLRRVE